MRVEGSTRMVNDIYGRPVKRHNGWTQNDYHNGWTQNDYPNDVRMAFVDYVDSLARNGEISEALAQKATL